MDKDNIKNYTWLVTQILVTFDLINRYMSLIVHESSSESTTDAYILQKTTPDVTSNQHSETSENFVNYLSWDIAISRKNNKQTYTSKSN